MTGSIKQWYTDPVETAEDAPLQHYIVIGMTERWDGPAGARVPAGTCWKCHTAIGYCVQVRSLATEEEHEIGTTCAELLGLDVTQIKELIAERRAAERAEREAEAHRIARAAESEVPEHGHGTAGRFFQGCRCLGCIDAVVAAFPSEYRIVASQRVLVDLATGAPVRAEVEDGRFGRQWHLRSERKWLPMTPVRRTTLSRRGYVEADVPCLVRRDLVHWRTGARRQAVDVMVCAFASPLVDVWGVPIPHRIQPAAAP